MAIDPIANLWAEASDGTEYAYEMSDPVEEDTFLVDGIQMSNFVHPSWFEPFKHPSGTKYDHLGLLKAPFSMTKGGYVIIKKNGKVTQKYGSKAKEIRFKKEDRLGHRSEYRKPLGKGLRILTPTKRRKSQTIEMTMGTRQTRARRTLRCPTRPSPRVEGGLPANKPPNLHSEALHRRRESAYFAKACPRTG